MVGLYVLPQPTTAAQVLQFLPPVEALPACQHHRLHLLHEFSQHPSKNYCLHLFQALPFPQGLQDNRSYIASLLVHNFVQF